MQACMPPGRGGVGSAGGSRILSNIVRIQDGPQ